MNATRLNELLARPVDMSAEDLNALENLCRDFPAFGLPYFLLARAYHDRNDYRYRETLHAAALRCPSRHWLREFMEGGHQLIPGNLPVEQGSDQAVETKVLRPVETVPEAIVSTHKPTDVVRIQEPFHEESRLSPGDQLQTDSIPETRTALPEQNEVPEDPDSELESVPVQELPILHEVTEVALTEEVNKPHTTAAPTDNAVENKSRRRLTDPAAMTVYAIEDHFPPAEQPTEQSGVRDFFAWLRNPHKATEASIPQPEPKEEKDDIIRRFLETRPSVSRPKKEFFNPVNMAKKSEQEDPELITETLANIYWKQGNTQKAIAMFEKLILKYPGKRPYFAALIQKIRQENES